MKSTARGKLFRFFVALFAIAFIVGGVIVTSLQLDFFEKITRRTFVEALLNWGSSIYCVGLLFPCCCHSCDTHHGINFQEIEGRKFTDEEQALAGVSTRNNPLS